MIGYGIGYPIGTPNRGANRVGTNPPTRPDPIPLVTSVGMRVGHFAFPTYDARRAAMP